MICHCLFPYDDYNDDIDDGDDNVATINIYHVPTMCQQLCYRFIEITLVYSPSQLINPLLIPFYR